MALIVTTIMKNFCIVEINLRLSFPYKIFLYNFPLWICDGTFMVTQLWPRLVVAFQFLVQLLQPVAVMKKNLLLETQYQLAGDLLSFLFVFTYGTSSTGSFHWY